jgi:6-phosphogluconate dehydrogenase
MPQPRLAMIGMAVMGSNFAQNFAEKGYDIAIYNRTTSRTKEVYEQHIKQQPYANRIYPVYGGIEDLGTIFTFQICD